MLTVCYRYRSFCTFLLSLLLPSIGFDELSGYSDIQINVNNCKSNIDSVSIDLSTIQGTTFNYRSVSISSDSIITSFAH